jgi:hypothetical protein
MEIKASTNGQAGAASQTGELGVDPNALVECTTRQKGYGWSFELPNRSRAMAGHRRS